MSLKFSGLRGEELQRDLAEPGASARTRAHHAVHAQVKVVVVRLAAQRVQLGVVHQDGAESVGDPRALVLHVHGQLAVGRRAHEVRLRVQKAVAAAGRVVAPVEVDSVADGVDLGVVTCRACVASCNQIKKIS